MGEKISIITGKEKIENKFSILSQYKSYFQWLHYNIFLKKKYKKIVKLAKQEDIKLKKKLKELDELLNKKGEYIGHIKHVSKPEKTLKLYLESYPFKTHNVFYKLWVKLFRFDGYVLYLNKANDLRMYKIKDLRFLKQIKNRELYNLDKKVGYFRGKPFYFVKYPIPISLEVEGDGFFYDAEAHNNYVNSATKINLTNLGEKFNVAEFIKSNIILVIIILALVLLFFTPEGKEFLAGILPK